MPPLAVTFPIKSPFRTKAPVPLISVAAVSESPEPTCTVPPDTTTPLVAIKSLLIVKMPALTATVFTVVLPPPPKIG